MEPSYNAYEFLFRFLTVFMVIKYRILVNGNSLSFRGGFFGFSSVVLIDVPDTAPILFDTGHHSTRLLLLNALKQHGLSPQDIGTVFLSHLHFDHINNIDLFPNADIYFSAKEWEYAQNPATADTFGSIAMNAYLKARTPQLLDAHEGELKPGLFYRHAPGHTPGSMLLHFTNHANQTIVLAGDACKTYRELVTYTVESEFDPQQRSAATLKWIATHADVVVPGHFAELHRSPNGWTWESPTHLDLIVR